MFNSRSSISISTFLSSLIGSIVRGRRSVRCGQTCEYRKARLILTHDPGEELFLGALHPAAALFREHIDIPELIAEHATYRKVLEEAGARVLTVRQILLDGTGADGKPADRTKLENLRRFAAGFLTFDTQNLSPETAEQQKEYRQSILAKTSPRDLVRIILRQPIIRLSETQINTGLKAEYSENPVMNLFYTRDQLITTAKGIVIGRMNSPSANATAYYPNIQAYVTSIHHHLIGGECRIRTHGRLSPSTVFKTATISHSVNSPNKKRRVIRPSQFHLLYLPARPRRRYHIHHTETL